MGKNMNETEYIQKFNHAIQATLYAKLTEQEQNFLRQKAIKYRFSHQNILQLIEYCRDLHMWQEQPLSDWWQQQNFPATYGKKEILNQLQKHIQNLKQKTFSFPQQPFTRPRENDGKIKIVESDKKIYGKCPVASMDTVCCNLHTIDVVENCTFGCSYCTIPTFYQKDYVFDSQFAQKLAAIPIDANKQYHFCTGQSSDSLVWGNKHGVLDALFAFARKHPNIILEFKTKSKNIGYFLKNRVPENIICSWSVNPQRLVDNEEHFTASLNDRLQAAKKLAESGIKICFHFHPMIHYQNWQQDYRQLVEQIKDSFTTEQIGFISLGTLTFLKPVLKKIRSFQFYSKILQMEFARDPKKKYTYPDAIKIELFNYVLSCFKDWRKQVFFYLCMEKAEIWQQTLGLPYQNNEKFEKALLAQFIPNKNN